MPIAYIFATRRHITFQPMKSIRSNSLSLKVLKAHTISRLQRYRNENISVDGNNSVPLGRCFRPVNNKGK